MTRKIKVIVLIFALSLTLSFMSNTYSRYVDDTTGNVKVAIAKWQILVNENDITNQTSSSIEITPVIDFDANVAAGTIAPTSSGHFDIDINPENVDVSFDYEITLSVLNDNMPDLMITEYSILPSDYIEGKTIDIIPIEDNLITGSLDYDNSELEEGEEPFKFKPFTVRVYFEWYEGTNELMDDENDTAIATSEEETTLDIEATIQFKQKI